MLIEIAGIKLLITAKNTDLIKDLKNKYQTFLTDNKAQDCLEINIEHDPGLNQSDQMQEIQLEKYGNIFKLNSADFKATVNFKAKFIAAMISSQEGAASLFLRVVFSLILLENNGFLVHAAGFKDLDNHGLIFVGPSGSGKTTLAAWGEKNKFSILSDELVAIREIDGKFLLFSTPFYGEFKGEIINFNVSLNSLFFLKPKIENRFQKLETIGTFLKLLENVFFFNRQTQENQNLINLIRELAAKVQGYEINLFNQDIGEVIYEAKSDALT